MLVGLFRNKNKDDTLPGRRRQPAGDVRTPSAMSDREHVFVRNRTLTGSTSTYLSDPYRQSDLKSPRSHAHHLGMKRRKIGIIFLVVIGIIIVLAFLLQQFTASVTIATSDTSLSRKLDVDRYKKAIDEYLGGHPFSRLRLMLDKNDLRAYLTSVVPEVVDVTDVSFASIGETKVTLTMRQPVAGWTINNKQYFVDANGVAYEQNYFATPTVQIIDNSGIALQQGSTVASDRFLGFVGRVVALSKEKGYQVIQAIIPTDTTRQLEIVLQNNSSHIKFSIDRAAGEQVEDMANALRYLSARGQSPSYVDVRVSGKAFYK